MGDPNLYLNGIPLSQDGSEFQFSTSQMDKDPKEEFTWRAGAKNYMDKVHDYIQIPADCWRIIDTPQFQRMSDIKQLGVSYLVYPGATHTRKEHSIGVGHLANKLIQHIYVNQKAELDMEVADTVAVRLGGLCHDLGHGPFSHVFCGEILPMIAPGSGFKHEQMSVDMLQYLIDANYVDLSHDKGLNPEGIDKEDCLKQVKRIIMASETGASDGPNSPSSNNQGDLNLLANGAAPSVARRTEKSFLLDIVANPKSGNDVDKWDYVRRDSQACGYPINFNEKILLYNCRVQEDELCFRSKAYDTCCDLFTSRARLFRGIYTHKTVKACEYMVRDAILLANPVLKLEEKITSPAAFMQLDDTLLKQLEWSTAVDPQVNAIIRRLRTRDLYKCVGKYVVPPVGDPDAPMHAKKVTELDITSHQTVDGTLRPEDIIVENSSIHHGLKEANPVERIKFFEGSGRAFRLRDCEVRTMAPTNFLERRVRVYCKSAENAHKVLAAFLNFQQKRFHRILDTPHKAAWQTRSVTLDDVSKKRKLCYDN
eukprot:jgi/Mesvir1/17175/Mv07597-RA.1